MKRMLRNVAAVAASIATLIMVTYCVLMTLGLRPFILSSSSMEPLYPKGSLVLVDTKVTPDDIKTGDVVAYRAAGGMMVLHRYVDDGEMQGDANNIAQAVKLTSANLIGRERLTIPLLGDLVSALGAHRRVIVVIAIVLLIAACCAR